ncbi:MAG TPA: GNAT family N-acetyltransferase [Terriglobales bacterium]|jgi:GNAT superfamily N-acetyltransferase
MDDLNIRAATPNDINSLLSLIRGLAAYEKKPDAVVATEQDLLRDMFGPHPKFRALLAEWNGEPAGYASFFHFYSTYQGRSALFLEDLFVPEKFRGHGIGIALLREVAQLAIDEGCFGLRWEVLDWNVSAIEFYQKLGATFLNERKAVTFDQNALRRIAEAK